MGLPVVVALVTTGLLAGVCAEPREQFVFRLLSVYAAGPDQAIAADRDKNDKVTDTEFLQSLYFFTDEKRDRRVTQAEFVDGYRRQFGLPSELLVIMFDLLDDLNDDGSTRQGNEVTDNQNNKFFDMFSTYSAGSDMFAKNAQNRGDGVLTPRDVTVRKFIGEAKQPSKEEYRKSLMKWVAAAADRLYTINYQPHIPGNPWDMEFDYERWFNGVDRNNDSLVSFKELSDEFRRYSPDGRVKRSRWVERNLKVYGDKEWLANVIFDYWDKNKDLRLDDLDVGLILKEADRNRDMRVTTIEFHRFMEKYNKRARRRLATPVRPVMYDCPSPWWQSFGCRPRVDATRAAMDMDDNFDGWITQGELRKRVSYYDRNGDGWASRMEVMMVESMRYGVKGPVASVMFDIYDRNGDGRYDNKDVQFMLAGQRVLCFCDARRAVLDLVKLSEKFQGSLQARGPAGSRRNAMRWQMARQWRWRKQVEKMWSNIWGGDGSPGGGCREGDCTGKDWRGGAWFSPFDWRQKNRMPENFLQWSYLRDIPRTLSLPQGFAPGGGQFVPGERPEGWPQGGTGGGGMGFPPRGPGNRPGSSQFPSGSNKFMPMPQNFMPNPSRISSRPGNSPRTSGSRPFMPGNFPFGSEDSDNSAEEFWNRLLAGLDNDTMSGRDSSWFKANRDFLQQGFSKNELFPGMAQNGGGNEMTDNRDWSWNKKSGRSGLNIFGKGDARTQSKSNSQASAGKKHQPDTMGKPDRAKNSGQGRGGMSNNRGRQHPSQGSARFRRDVGVTASSQTTVSPVPAPPSPTTQTSITENIDTVTNTTDPDSNSTVDDDHDQSSGLHKDQTSQGDKDINSETDDKPSDQAADKIGRSLGWFGPPFANNWLNYARDLRNCDSEDAWVQGRGDDGGFRDWDSQQRWDNWPTMEGDRPFTNSAPPIWTESVQYPPYTDQSSTARFPAWMHRKFPAFWWSGTRQHPAFTPSGFTSGTPGNYFYPGQHRVMKRSPDGVETTDDSDELGRWMGRNYNGIYPHQLNSYNNRFNGYSDRFYSFPYRPQWWNMGNNGGHSSFFPGNLYPPSNNQMPLNSPHSLFKRNTDDQNNGENLQDDKETAKWMGPAANYGASSPGLWNNDMNMNGFPYSSHYPQWWNMWRGYQSWPQSNGWNTNQMWSSNGGPNSFFPGHSSYFTQGWRQGFRSPMSNQHTMKKRSADTDHSHSATAERDKVARWMGNGNYGNFYPNRWNQFNRYSYTPQWWQRRNSYSYWPGYGNNFQMWRNYQNYNQPFYFSKSDTTPTQTVREKRGADDEMSEKRTDTARMMNGYGGHWPQWWNMWNSYRYWPRYWNNYNWMWNNYSPFYYSKDTNQDLDKEHVVSKRSTDEQGQDSVSRMMGWYGGYWPQWWNMWNYNRYWPGHRNSHNWMWNNFYFSKNGNLHQPDKEHILSKRSTDDHQGDQISRMMNGYVGYQPQWGNMWNSNKYWPGQWNNRDNNWMWNYRNPYQYTPFFFANADKAESERIRLKRNTDKTNSQDDKVSRMMGWYGGYWPQWWNLWNYNRYWPGYWNNNWMWNNFYHYYPFFFSNADTSMDTPVRAKRSTGKSTEDEDVSRMMGWYGGHWPQWWNYNRYWPGYWNNNWMWNNYGSFYRYYPFFFSKTGASADQPIRAKRSTEESTNSEDISRMMGWYGGHWPQWWNMWNYNRYWPGHWNNNWMWNNFYYPFYFSKDDKKNNPEKEHVMSKRSVDQNQEEVSRMMGWYGGHWPQWWNMWNYNRYWPGQWYNWMGNYGNFYRYYPFFFSHDGSNMEERVRMKRSPDAENAQDAETSRMMGSYGGYWPQRWNTYRHWPMFWNNQNQHWMGNSLGNYYRYYPFFYSKNGNPMEQHFRMKRSTDAVNTNDEETSRMMGGYGGHWPQWWYMWNTRRWPGYGNNNWMWNNHRNFYQYYPFSFSENDDVVKEHIRLRRSPDGLNVDEKETSRMFGGHWWNMWNNNMYWPGYWYNSWMWNNHRWNYPFFSKTNPPADGSEAKVHIMGKREAVSQSQGEQSSNMQSEDGPLWRTWNGYWPGQWNMWNSKRQWPRWMWNFFNQFFPYFSQEENQEPDKESTRTKRSTDDHDKEDVSRMMSGYNGFWPQWWNMWNYNRYWPGYWNNQYWMWNSYYPFYFSKDNSQELNREHVMSKRSIDGSSENSVSRMMGWYGGYWPQWWNMWNYNRYWPGYWNNNWMWNSYHPFSFSKEDNKEGTEKEHVRSKRSTDEPDLDSVSRMMDGYGGQWPQWWNSYRYWPGYWNNWNWMWNRNNHFSFAEDGDQQSDKEHILNKRSTPGDDKEVSRMMGWYGGHWPQWWNMWNYNRYWPGYWNNNWMWNNFYYPFYFSKDDKKDTQDKEHVMSKRSVDQNQEEVSRMMGGYGGHWPQWWNMWNYNRYWPGYWNNNWMWNNFYYPFYFSKDDKKDTQDKEHVMSKRSVDQNQEEVSRMMGWYGGHWPQWWNMWNYNRYWPGYWNSNWMWNNYASFYRYYPFFYSHAKVSTEPPIRAKRYADESGNSENVSRMMGWHGGYRPQWWNMWNYNRYWPGYWNNSWMWNSYYPFYFSKEDNKENTEKEHVRSKRSTDESDQDSVSRMMGGYGGYWPQWWNSYRYWPGYWNNWNWMLNRHFPFYFSKDNSQEQEDKEHVLSKRSTDQPQDQVSRMMGGYGGYWSPWYYNHWSRWNSWNNYNWMWNRNNHFSFAEDGDQQSDKEHILNKRSTPGDDKEVSRMMGWYGGHWPQWWNMWNYNRYWPGHWNNNWMWNNFYYPFYFSKDDKKDNPEKEHVMSKRSVDQNQEEVSRMMGWYGGHWPQWWNMWNYNRYWPGYWNNNWMWNNYGSFYRYYPFLFSKDASPMETPLRMKRSTSENTEDKEVSRMMGWYGDHWPQWWNMRNYNRYWPGHWNNNWMWNNFYYPFYFSKDDKKDTQGKEHVMSKRSVDQNQEEVSRMMGWYGGYWPQWWNMWNYNRYWPGYWNNNWMWNSYYPFYFSKEDNKEDTEKEHVRSKRSTDESDQDSVSRMMGGYGGQWPQWWNSYRYWPGYWNNWNWMLNRHFPFYFSKDNSQEQEDKEHVLSKRSTDQPQDQVSRMMGGYGGYWPQWWNMWNYNRYWPGYWNNNWMGNNYRSFYRYYPFFYSHAEASTDPPIRAKRNVDESTNDEEVSRMMGWYGGNWPQWWNMWNYNRYWPGNWNNNWMWNNNGNFYRYYPFFFSNSDSAMNQPVRVKRNADFSTQHEETSRMMGWHGGYWPQWWNMWNYNWPQYGNNYWMWNSYYPFYFSKDDRQKDSEKEHLMSKRSADKSEEDDVSRMMGGYGRYWPQQWNMWRNYWSRWNFRNDDRWMWNGNSNFYFAKDGKQQPEKEHLLRKRSADNQGQEDVSHMMNGFNFMPGRWNRWNNYQGRPDHWHNYYRMWNSYFPFYFSQGKNKEPSKEHILSRRSAEQNRVSRMMGGYRWYWPQWWSMWNNYRHRPGFRNHNMNWNSYVDWNSNMNQNGNMNWNYWMSNRYKNRFPYSPNYFPQNYPSEYGHHVFKRDAEDSKEHKDRVAHMMNADRQFYRPQWWNMWYTNRYWPGYRNNRPRWGSNFNGYNWIQDQNYGNFLHSPFFRQPSGEQDFPFSNGYQQNMWNTGYHTDFPRSFHPFAFAKEEKPSSQKTQDSGEQREKRSAESLGSDGETTEAPKNTSTEDTNTTDTKSSKPTPDVARQIGGYEDSPGNMYQRQWWRLYRSYLNSMPRYWSDGPYFSMYRSPYDSPYGRRYSNRYRLYYFVRYVMPWRVYRYLYRPVWNNRKWSRNWEWDGYDSYPGWDYHTAGNSPFSHSWSHSTPDPSIRQQKENAEASVQEETEIQGGDTNSEEEQRSKRSIRNMNYPSSFPYNRKMSGYNNFHSSWPYWWADGMQDYNYWPWWNFYTYNPMWSRRNWNNWMWSGYNDRAFMSSRKDELSDEKTEHQADLNGPAADQNEESTMTESARTKRSTEQQTGQDQPEDISRWLDIPNQAYSQPMWNNGMPGWMGRRHGPGPDSFRPDVRDGYDWNKNFMMGMGNNGWNRNTDQESVWNSMGMANPFSFSTEDKEDDNLSSGTRHERSAEMPTPAGSSDVDSEPGVSRWMTGYSMPPMSVSTYPMNQGWQYSGYNSQRRFMTWNRWGEGESWNNWNTAYSGSVPSFPYSFSTDHDLNGSDKIRQKRSSDDFSNKDDSETGVEDGTTEPRMGRRFGRIGNVPMGWNKHQSRFFNNPKWGPYNRLMYKSFRPWWSRWNRLDQYQYGPMWNQDRYNPSWNQHQNMPPWGLGNDGQVQNDWNNMNQFSGGRVNHFNNEHVDESVFDPLSSYYFSHKDTSSDSTGDERLEKSTSEKTTSANVKDDLVQQEESRSRRSVISLTGLLSKGNVEPEKYKVRLATMLKPGRRFSKRNVSYKVKRFSPEATARLEKRFQKRSPASIPDSPAEETKDANAEIAPKMAMRATAPARGQSTRDREWGPPRGGGFHPDPSADPRLTNRNEVANLRLNPGRDSDRNPGQGQPLNPFTNFGGPDDWNWDQPGWDGGPDWFGPQDPRLTGDGQDAGDKGPDKAGPQGGSSGNTDGTSSTTNGDKKSDVPSDNILNGDAQNRLSNYNYIDFNNPNYWNKFYNPASFNSSAGGPLGNSTQWNNWFGLWAYGPNFWDDMNDLDLWDAPWAAGSWIQGPGGDEWGRNWWLDPDTGYNLMPVEMQLESYWLDDCDDGFRPWRKPDRRRGEGCRSCFRPYSPAFRRYLDFIRPRRYFAVPTSFSFRPRPLRPLPRGLSGRPWFFGFPPFPKNWNVDGKAQWSGFPWWGWNPNSFWNPWRYRIQYRSNLDNKVRRTRRAAPSSVNTLGSTSTTVNKLVPTASTVNKKRGPVNSPSLPSPFNGQGLVGPRQFPSHDKPGLYFNPSLVAPFNYNDGGRGWNLANTPPTSGQPPSMGSRWSGLPWWDKNNWHMADTRNDFNGFPDRQNLGSPRNIFSGFPGARKFPAQFGPGRGSGHWSPGSPAVPGQPGFGRPATPWRNRNILRPPGRGFHPGPLYQESGGSAEDLEGERARSKRSQSWQAMNTHDGVTPPLPWNPSPWNTNKNGQKKGNDWPKSGQPDSQKS